MIQDNKSIFVSFGKTCLSYNEAPDRLKELPAAGATIYAGWTNHYYTIKYVFNSEDESSPCATGYYYYGNGGGTDNMRRVTEYEVIIPKGVESIGTRAFAGCKQLRKVTLPTPVKIKQIGDEAFLNCEMLGSFMPALPDECEVGKNVFKGCKE